MTDTTNINSIKNRWVVYHGKVYIKDINAPSQAAAQAIGEYLTRMLTDTTPTVVIPNDPRLKKEDR